MEYVHLFAQTFLDTLAMYFLCIFIAKEPFKFNKKMVYWFVLFQLFCIIVRLEIGVDPGYMYNKVAFLNFDILPVNSWFGMVFLLLAMLILNSLYFRLTNVGVLVTTALAFVLWMFIRLFSIVITGLFIETDSFYHMYGYRVLTVLLAFLIYAKLSIALLNAYTARQSMFTKIMLVNTLIAISLLVAYANFDTEVLLKNMLYVIIALSFILLLNIWIVLEQRKTVKREKRVEVIAQYMPVIDELVSEVRARQHEFDNKLLAISSIIETAEDLTTAREQMRAYTKSGIMEENLKEILLSDRKVIAGFLYTKAKLAELKKIELKTEIHTDFEGIYVEEYEMIEVLGILIDNAIEACQSDTLIHVLINKVDEQIEIKVSNPHTVISNTTFLEMFEKGYTTKNIQSNARGFGLYNVKQIALQNGGKLITKNSNIDGRNYVTIGIRLP